jgi:hypothetical protein
LGNAPFYVFKNEFEAQPIITVGAPTTMAPPWAVLSPNLAAGIPAIITVAEPAAIVSGGPTQTHMSPTRAAGIPAIITVGAPIEIGPPTCGTGPGLTIGQVCISPILALGIPIALLFRG